jgi:hypothetical protein
MDVASSPEAGGDDSLLQSLHALNEKTASLAGLRLQGSQYQDVKDVSDLRGVADVRKHPAEAPTEQDPCAV